MDIQQKKQQLLDMKDRQQQVNAIVDYTRASADESERAEWVEIASRTYANALRDASISMLELRESSLDNLRIIAESAGFVENTAAIGHAMRQPFIDGAQAQRNGNVLLETVVAGSQLVQDPWAVAKGVRHTLQDAEHALGNLIQDQTNFLTMERRRELAPIYDLQHTQRIEALAQLHLGNSLALASLVVGPEVIPEAPVIMKATTSAAKQLGANITTEVGSFKGLVPSRPLEPALATPGSGGGTRSFSPPSVTDPSIPIANLPTVMGAKGTKLPSGTTATASTSARQADTTHDSVVKQAVGSAELNLVKAIIPDATLTKIVLPSSISFTDDVTVAVLTPSNPLRFVRITDNNHLVEMSYKEVLANTNRGWKVHEAIENIPGGRAVLDEHYEAFKQKERQLDEASKASKKVLSAEDSPRRMNAKDQANFALVKTIIPDATLTKNVLTPSTSYSGSIIAAALTPNEPLRFVRIKDNVATEVSYKQILADTNRSTLVENNLRKLQGGREVIDEHRAYVMLQDQFETDQHNAYAATREKLFEDGRYRHRPLAEQDHKTAADVVKILEEAQIENNYQMRERSGWKLPGARLNPVLEAGDEKSFEYKGFLMESVGRDLEQTIETQRIMRGMSGRSREDIIATAYNRGAIASELISGSIPDIVEGFGNYAAWRVRSTSALVVDDPKVSEHSNGIAIPSGMLRTLSPDQYNLSQYENLANRIYLAHHGAPGDEVIARLPVKPVEHGVVDADAVTLLAVKRADGTVDVVKARNEFSQSNLAGASSAYTRLSQNEVNESLETARSWCVNNPQATEVVEKAIAKFNGLIASPEVSLER